MKEIASTLIDFGMEFQYESYGSRGEKIISFILGVSITRQEGKIYFEHMGELETFEDNDKYMLYVNQMVHVACVEETT